MTTQYTPILKLALPVTGELSGTWGTVVNDNITSMVEQAVAGLSTINTWTANAHTLTTADGTSSEARCAMLVLATGAGGTALTAAGEVICPAASKLYVVKNGSAYAVTVKTSAGTGVAIPAGDTAFVFCDGTNVNACVTTIVNGHISGNLTVDGNTTLGDATSDTITATARFNTDLLPSTDNARDLGSTANSWRTLYCDTSVLTPLVTATNLQVTNIKANDGTAVAVLTDSTGATDFSKAFTLSAIAQNISLGASQTTGTFVLGGTAATGAITLDQSTKAHTLNIGSGATENATTKTINIGTGGVSGSTTTITIGSSNGTTTTFNGTVNVTTLDLTNLEVTNIKAKDGTASITLADSTGVASFTANPILSGGTANGVVYLNASKVATTGTALTFDGSNLSSTGGATFQGGPTGYGGGEVRLGTTASGQQSAISTIAVDSPVLFFDHRGTSNTGVFVWRNGTAGANELARLTSTGLGIGTNASTAKLQVVGGQIKSGILDSADNNNIGGIIMYASNTAAGRRNWAIKPESAEQGTLGFFVSSANNSEPLSGKQVVSITSTGTLNIVGAGTAGSTQAISFNGSTPVDTLVTTSGGLVGIGTSSPAYKLDVRAANASNSTTDMYGTPMLCIDTSSYAQNVGGGISFGYRYNSSNSVIDRAVVIKAVKENATDGNYATALIFGTTANAASTTEKMRLDSSGNLGLGVTPSAWGSAYRAIEIGGAGTSLFSGTGAVPQTYLTANAFFNGTNWIYKGTYPAVQYEQSGGQHKWNIAASDAAGNAITFTQAMTLDASGRLLVGYTTTQSFNAALQVKRADATVGATTYTLAWFANATGYENGLAVKATDNVVTLAADFNGAAGGAAALVFATNSTGTANNATERARITSGGDLLVGTTSNASGSPKIAVNGSIQPLWGQYRVATVFDNSYRQGLYFDSTNRNMWVFSTTNDTGGNIIFSTRVGAGSSDADYGTERARITSGGDFVVGPVGGNGNGVVKASDAAGTNQPGSNLLLKGGDGGGTGSSYVAIFTAPGGSSGSSPSASVERVRITPGGNLWVGTDSVGSIANGGFAFNPSTNSYQAIGHKLGTASGDYYIGFYYDGGVIGNITQNGTTAVAYNTSSDYRLKDNPQPLTNSGAFIDALKPKTWNWKADGSKGVGFIAHEVQEVSPGTVVGTKDAVDADGKPIMQAMEYGSAEFIANIVAELQSLRARVAQLEQGA